MNISEKLKSGVDDAKAFWHVYRRNRLGVFGITTLSIILVIAISADFIAPFDPTRIEKVGPDFAPPQWIRLFNPGVPIEETYGLLGTDNLGRDVFSQIVHGARISLVIGLLAAAIAVLIGLLIGLFAGYFGGIVDNILMRVTDVILTLPLLVFLIVLTAILGSSLWNAIVLIGLMWWTRSARIVRSQVLTLKERAFIKAAKSVGASNLHIIFRHILPNVTPLLFANATIAVEGAIVLEAGLSFMGLGPQNVASWGRMIHEALASRAFLLDAWWYYLPPGIMISITILSFVFIGQALDVVYNPRLRT